MISCNFGGLNVFAKSDSIQYGWESLNLLLQKIRTLVLLLESLQPDKLLDLDKCYHTIKKTGFRYSARSKWNLLIIEETRDSLIFET